MLAFPNFVKALTGSYFLASILATLINNLYSPVLNALFQDSLPKDARGFSSSVIDGISWVIPSVFSLSLEGIRVSIREIWFAWTQDIPILDLNLLSGIGVLRCALSETLVKSETVKPDIYPFKEFFSSLNRFFEWAYRSTGYLLIIQAFLEFLQARLQRWGGPL